MIRSTYFVSAFFNKNFPISRNIGVTFSASSRKPSYECSVFLLKSKYWKRTSKELLGTSVHEESESVASSIMANFWVSVYTTRGEPNNWGVSEWETCSSFLDYVVVGMTSTKSSIDKNMFGTSKGEVVLEVVVDENVTHRAINNGITDNSTQFSSLRISD